MGLSERLKGVFSPKRSDDDFVACQGLKLPPRRMRLGSMPGKPDETYVNYAKGSVRLLEKFTHAEPGHRFVDIGSGPGRLLIGMHARWGKVESYRGLDVDREAIDWARQHLSDRPTIDFLHIDVQSSRYNPEGESLAAGFALPLPRDSADRVLLFSVFSHMFLDEIDVYLAEIGRILSDDGKVFFTAFVEEGVPAEEENPPDYLSEWRGPVHCVRLNRNDLEDRIARNGFRLEVFEHQRLGSGQSVCVLSRVSGP